MKILKKLLCAVLCLSLVFAITACDKKEEKSEKTSAIEEKKAGLNKTSKKIAESSDEEEIEELVNEAMERRLTCDMGGYYELTNDKEKAEIFEDIHSVEDYMYMSSEGEDIDEEIVETIIDKFSEGLEECEYEIISIEGEDDEYTVEFSAIIVDFEDFLEEISETYTEDDVKVACALIETTDFKFIKDKGTIDIIKDDGEWVIDEK